MAPASHAGGRRPISTGLTDVLVLAYHAVSADWQAPLAVTPQSLEHQLGGLVARGYRSATFRDAVHAPPHRRTLAITFDDAYRSNIELAFPIMQRLGVVGTVFVPTDFTGARLVWPGIDEWVGGAHDGELQAMTVDDLRTLRDAGWEIGSHTCSHPHLTELDDTALRAELVQSRDRCEEILGESCTTLAYPYGDHDARVVAATRAAGYDAACTLPERMSRPGALCYPRVAVYRVDGNARFRAKVAPLARRLRSGPAWPLAARALRHS